MKNEIGNEHCRLRDEIENRAQAAGGSYRNDGELGHNSAEPYPTPLNSHGLLEDPAPITGDYHVGNTKTATDIQKWAASLPLHHRSTTNSGDYSANSFASIPPSKRPSRHARPSTNGSSSWGPRIPQVHLNINSQRVDIALPPVNIDVSRTMNKMNSEHQFCYYWHLGKFCSTENCPRRHGDSLDDEQIAWLQRESRRIRCHYGLRCKSTNCYRGHNCSSICCNQKSCVFRESHGMDRTVVDIIPA